MRSGLTHGRPPLPTYDVLVADELLPEFTNDNPRMPEGFRIVGPVAGLVDPGRRMWGFRVEDDNAPAWTEGKLVDPVFTAGYEMNDQGHPTGNYRVTVTDWIEVTA